MIELQNVTKVFDGNVTAVEDVSFTVAEHETFGLIGTSGCGKTTTLRMINRLIEPTSGSVLIDGEPADARPPEELRREIGYVIQSVGLFPHYTIRENIGVVPRLKEWEEPKVRKRTDELLKLVGLEPDRFADRFPDALSGGQQQRVGLARALAAEPPLILMDEPFGALDPITKEKVRNEFRELLEQIRKTVVLVTHDVVEAFDLCERICLMDGGRIRQVGTPKELLFQPADGFVRSFFDSHRTELEMRAVRLGDLADTLQLNSTDPSSSPVTLRASCTVDEAVSAFDDREVAGEMAEVVDERENTVAHMSSDDILTAFNRVRRQWRKGGLDD